MDEGSIKAVALLDDRVRAALYRYVCEAQGPVTREQAGAAAGVSRKLAAFHLDKMVAGGLLEASTPARGHGRVGRAPKAYRRSNVDVQVSLPPRRPQVLADILMGAVLDERPGEPSRAAALRVAHDRGVALGAAERDRVRPGRLGAERALAMAETLLARQGFQPSRDGTGLHLRNCPFHRLAATHPDLVCGLNAEYLQGMLDGLQSEQVLQTVPDRAGGGCCLQVAAR